jgi:hypothetical protein
MVVVVVVVSDVKRERERFNRQWNRCVPILSDDTSAT